MNAQFNNIGLIVGQIAGHLRDSGTRLAVAESCTGGWIAKVLTDLPGSSAWFEYGFVSYGNNAKASMLGVDAMLIEQHGAVSQEVAEAMAHGAANAAGADWSLAVTGVAGPDGGTRAKPVGTVWFAWRDPRGTVDSDRQCFAGNRDGIRRATVAHALSGLFDRMRQ